MDKGEYRLLKALINLKNSKDFAYFFGWLSETRAEYLRLWKVAPPEKLQNLQGRFAAIDDLLLYLGTVEQRMEALRKKEEGEIQ